jgi:hypothetical protein
MKLEPPTPAAAPVNPTPIGAPGVIVVRSMVAITATALVLWLAQSVWTWAIVITLFGQLWGLLVLAIAVTLTGVVVAAILRVCTGRHHILGAVVVTISTAVLLAVALVRYGTIPMIWVQPGFELVHLLVSVIAAPILGLFLGPRWLRVVGAAALAGWLAFAIWFAPPTTPSQDDQLHDQQQQQADANFEYYIENGVFPLVADLPGGTIVGHVPDGGPPRTLVLTADGGVVEIAFDSTPLETKTEIWPCWSIAEPNMGLEETDMLEDYAGWCVKDEAGWVRTDGTGVARIYEGGLVAVKAATEQNVDLAGGERPGTPTEVAEALAVLRPMTEDEVRVWLGPEYGVN